MEQKSNIMIDGIEYIRKDRIKENTKPTMVTGKEYCIVRTYSAGVFAGYINRKTKGKENTIYNARRIWYWTGAASLSQLANNGTKTPDTCKFSQINAEIDLKEIIEIIPCTEKAKKSIESVKIWQN